ncbi:DMT family transporter [Cryobacterium sp. CAN_C3]|uniref:DMT family transporter n=1 Tax=Cryobacterium sp. CAN_C3 TaxID=3071721 RepID=UPI002E1174A4
MPLLLLAQIVEKPDWRVVADSWPRLLLLASLGIARYNLLLYTALQYTTPQPASLINAANPAVMMVVLAAILVRERPGCSSSPVSLSVRCAPLAVLATRPIRCRQPPNVS